MRCFWNSLFSVFLVSSFAEASPGVFEINQACVEIGCFEEDTPGFPVTLSHPGTYILSSDLTVSDPTVGAIVMQTNNISLDLNRFTISGPVVCQGDPLTCAPSGPAVGVNGEFFENLRIENGTIQGFSQWGLVTGPNGYVNGILSRGNYWIGINARAGTQVSNSKAVNNQHVGVSLAGTSIATEIIARGNFTGVAMGCGTNEGCSALLDSNVSQNNLGVYDWGGALIRGNVISMNLTRGIQNINGWSTIDGNQVILNEGSGVMIGGGTAFSQPASPVVLRNNRISGHAINVDLGTDAQFVDAGGNVCGDSVSCN